MQSAFEKVAYYREMLALSQQSFLKAKTQKDKTIIRKQVEAFRKLHMRYSTIAGIRVSHGQLELFKTNIEMENTEPSDLRTIYEMLDTQTVKQRKEFVQGLVQNKINRQQYNNWINKRCNIPEKFHQLICDLAGEQLTFPKLTMVPVLETQNETV